jgi:hypothetical protein
MIDSIGKGLLVEPGPVTLFRVPRTRSGLRAKYWEKRRVCLELADFWCSSLHGRDFGLRQSSRPIQSTGIRISKSSLLAGDLLDNAAVDKLRAARPDLVESISVEGAYFSYMVGHLSPAREYVRIRCLCGELSSSDNVNRTLACLEVAALWGVGHGAKGVILPFATDELCELLSSKESSGNASDSSEIFVPLQRMQPVVAPRRTFPETTQSLEFRKILSLSNLPSFLISRESICQSR